MIRRSLTAFGGCDMIYCDGTEKINVLGEMQAITYRYDEETGKASGSIIFCKLDRWVQNGKIQINFCNEYRQTARVYFKDIQFDETPEINNKLWSTVITFVGELEVDELCK
jgi:hypothetical protein